MYAIRPCRTEDKIMWLQTEILPADEPVPFEEATWWTASKLGFHNAPVGFIGFSVYDSWPEAAYICRTGVLEEHRGQGLQKRMTSVCCAAAKRRGFEWAYTDARNDNPASCNSFISSGFKLYLPIQPWGFPESCYWRKKITTRG